MVEQTNRVAVFCKMSSSRNTVTEISIARKRLGFKMKTVQAINLRFWDQVFCQNSLRFRVGFTLRKVSEFINKMMKKPFEKGLPLTEKSTISWRRFECICVALRSFQMLYKIFGKTFLLYTSCLVNRSHYCARLMRFGSRDPSDFSCRIRPRNVLTEKI